MNRQPKDVREALNRLNLLIAAIEHDVETYIDAPQEFDAKEYFRDVLEAATNAHNLVVWVRGEFNGVETRP